MAKTISEAVYLGLIAGAVIIFTDAIKTLFFMDTIKSSPGVVAIIALLVMIFAKRISEVFPG